MSGSAVLQLCQFKSPTCLKRQFANVPLTWPFVLELNLQAVQVVRAFPGGSDEDVETFIDRVFDEQHLISHAATVDMTRLEVREILGDWASVRGTMTFDQFNR